MSRTIGENLKKSYFIFFELSPFADLSRDMRFPTMWSKIAFSLFYIFKNYGLSRLKRYKFHFNMLSISVSISAMKFILKHTFDVMKLNSDVIKNYLRRQHLSDSLCGKFLLRTLGWRV